MNEGYRINLDTGVELVARFLDAAAPHKET